MTIVLWAEYDEAVNTSRLPATLIPPEGPIKIRFVRYSPKYGSSAYNQTIIIVYSRREEPT